MKSGENMKKRGMTLIEVIISLAILAIIAVSFLSIFTSGFSLIFKFGRKSKTVMNSNEIMNMIYETAHGETFTTSDQVQTMVSNVLDEDGYTGKYEKSDTLAGLQTKSGSELIRYFVSPEESKSSVAGYTVYLCFFQSDSGQSVILTSFITKGGS